MIEWENREVTSEPSQLLPLVTQSPVQSMLEKTACLT